MRKRLVTVAVLAALLGAAAYSAFSAPWYVARVGTARVPLRLIDLDYAHFVVLIVALVANVYFFARVMLTGLLVLLGGPTQAHRIAWYTPTSALLNAGVSLAASLVLYALTPEPAYFFDAVTRQERAWGGFLLVGANAGALVALLVIAKDHVLARTQTWVDDDGAPIPKKRRRWILAARAERPLVKPPLASPGMAAGDPFRAAPPTGLTAQLVKPPARVEAPRKDDADAPAPKLLT